MERHVLTSSKTLEILQSIVSPIAVDVMNVMACWDWTIGCFPNESMVKHSDTISRASQVSLMGMTAATGSY